MTGEIGAWLGLDAGTLKVGKRADVVVLDPERLSAELDVAVEAELEGFGGLVRMVNQNGGAVGEVLINGREALRDGALVPELGRARGFGRVLRAVASA